MTADVPGSLPWTVTRVQELETWGNGCECWVTPEWMWFRYGSAVEPGSQVEFNPECPTHGGQL